MARAQTVESRRDRLALARDAGWSRLSFTSIVAGTLVGFGAFALLLGVFSAVLAATGVDKHLSTKDWQRIGGGAGVVLVVVLFLAYLFGGYTAGRMARRSGAAHGLCVGVLGVVVSVAAAAVARLVTDTDAALNRLRDVGIPTSSGDWRTIGSVVGIASLVAILIGSVLGGIKGERWHGLLVSRALDPEYGPEAETRNQAEDAGRDARTRVGTATPVAAGAGARPGEPAGRWGDVTDEPAAGGSETGAAGERGPEELSASADTGVAEGGIAGEGEPAAGRRRDAPPRHLAGRRRRTAETTETTGTVQAGDDESGRRAGLFSRRRR